MNILEIPMQSNDADAETIGEYLIALLFVVWKEGECFSGKRPFGNSGWEWDVFAALVKAGAATGSFDEDGYLEDCDEKACRTLIANAIDKIEFAK